MLAYVGLCWPMLAYVGLSCGQCGPSLELCWPSLGLCWPILKAMWADLEAYVGRSWGLFANVDPCWGYVGLSWGQCGPILGLCWPSWGYVGLSWGLCCPIWRLCWSILRPMLAHVDPSSATSSKKWENGSSKKHRKAREFLAGGLSAAGAAAPFSFGEERCRTARTRPVWGPWPDLSAYARQPARSPCWGEMGLAGSKILGLCCPTGRPCKNHCKMQDILIVGG